MKRTGPITGPSLSSGSTSADGQPRIEIGPARSVATNPRLTETDGATRLTLDITESIEFDAFLLSSPPRLVVELPVVDFRLPDTVPRQLGLISDWRAGIFAPTQSRIVIDLTGPVRITQSRVSDPHNDVPGALVMEVETASDLAFETEVRKGRQKRSSAQDSAGAKGDRLPVRGSQRAIPLIVLDPGHGGIDLGTVGRAGALEKDVVLGFSRALAEELTATGDYQVKLTRNADVFMALDDRVAFARSGSADLFISIHADSVRQQYVRGASVYTVSRRASDAIARELAENENKSDMLAGVVSEEAEDIVTDILVDLMRRETKIFSVRFADTIVEEMRSNMNLVSNPHRYAGFRVLRAPDVPSVLLELGFLSNGADEELLTSAEWQEQAVSSVARSIDRFFGLSHKR